MNNIVERLKAKYPRYKVINTPDPQCMCKGTDEKKLPPSRLFPNGHEMPCLCVCLSGEGRAEVVKVFGNAARNLKRELGY